MIERLSQFIKKQGVSVRAFEQSISASDGMIRRAINNGTDIQSKWLSIIADNYPYLNLDWLITGRGTMIREWGENMLKQSVDVNGKMGGDFGDSMGGPHEKQTKTDKSTQMGNEAKLKDLMDKFRSNNLCIGDDSGINRHLMDRELNELAKSIARRIELQEKLEKANGVKLQYSQINGLISDLGMCLDLLRYYTKSRLDTAFDDYFSNKITLKELTDIFKSNTQNVSVLSKLLSPFFSRVSDLYDMISTFNELNDRVYCYDGLLDDDDDEENEDETDVENKKKEHS